MDKEVESQRCSKCKNNKRLSEFQKDVSKKLGVHSICRACRTKTGKKQKRYVAFEKEVNGVSITYKKCSKCKLIQQLNQFPVSRTSKSGFYASCKTCAIIKEEKVRMNKGRGFVVKDVATINGEIAKRCASCKFIKLVKDFTDNKLGLLGKSSECTNCLNTRATKFYHENKNELLEKNAIWYRKNVKYRINKDIRRRARHKGLIHDLSVKQQESVFEFFKGCALTGETIDCHWDHVIPLSIGHGGTTFGNMIPLKANLNTSKRDSNIFEWFNVNRQRFELSQERFDKLIAWLASANAMTVEEYRDYVYWCHANPRSVDELEAL
jgi:hypothetical protein